MKRKKRNYIVLMINSFFLIVCSVGIFSSIEHCFYGKTQGIVTSVHTEIYERDLSSDENDYVESTIRCSYTVDGRKYVGRYTYKNDYSRLEGKTVTILYDKKNPYESQLEEISIKGSVCSIILTIICVSLIVSDIKYWVNIRKEENESILQNAFSDSDKQQYTAQMKKQKRINIILIIASVLGLILLVLDIPLIVYTIARNIDYRSCNSIE